MSMEFHYFIAGFIVGCLFVTVGANLLLIIVSLNQPDQKSESEEVSI